jgi:hypothetical protein
MRAGSQSALKKPVSNTATHWRAASCRDILIQSDWLPCLHKCAGMPANSARAGPAVARVAAVCGRVLRASINAPMDAQLSFFFKWSRLCMLAVTLVC